jgi:glutamine synthetase
LLQTWADVMALIRNKGVVAVDLRFMDTCGPEQHITVPSDIVDEAAFADGLSSKSRFRGWAAIWDYDLRLIPVPESAFLDPFTKYPTLVLPCELVVSMAALQEANPIKKPWWRFW